MTELASVPIGPLTSPFGGCLGGLSEGLTISSVWPDYVKIRDAANAGNWTNDTPVPPEAFGDLWPHGTPPGWPDEQPAQ